MLEFRYDTQLLIDGKDLDEDEVRDYITDHFKYAYMEDVRECSGATLDCTSYPCGPCHSKNDYLHH